MAGIRHIVLVRFRADIAAMEIQAILDEIGALAEVIPGMSNYVAGKSVSPEAMEQGFGHGFTVDFADAAARDAYLPHPAHVKAGGRLTAAAEGGKKGLIVVDLNL